MKVRALRGVLGVGFLLAIGTGCGNAVKFPRYFEPPARKFVAKPPTPDSPKVRLGQVLAAPHLGTRMAWRISKVEVAYDQLNHWASPPAVMTQVAVERELFIERGFRQSGGADAAILSIDVTAFEGIQETRQAFVELLVAVRDRSGGIHTQRFGATYPATSDDPAALAEAAGEALDRAIGRLASWLETNSAIWTIKPLNPDGDATGSTGGTSSTSSGPSQSAPSGGSGFTLNPKKPVTPQAPELIDDVEADNPDRPRGRWAPATR